MIKTDLHLCIKNSTGSDLQHLCFDSAFTEASTCAYWVPWYCILFWKSSILLVWLCNSCRYLWVESPSFGLCLCCDRTVEMEKEETEMNKVNLHLKRMKSNDQKEVDIRSYIHMHACWWSCQSCKSHLLYLVEFFLLFTFFSPVWCIKLHKNFYPFS